MRAVVFDAIGDRGRVADVADPVPEPGEILIGVTAVGLIASDWRVRGGSRFPRQEHRFPAVLGFDFAGRVVVADEAGRWAVGDRLFGIAHKPYIGAGALADLVAMPADGPIALAPERFDDAEAASLVSGWLTSLATRRLLDDDISGRAIALLGASGGVGSVLTQLLAGDAADVLAVTRSVNEDYVRRLGAVEVIAHDLVDTVDEIARRWPGGIDGLIDLVSGRDRFPALARLVRPGGTVISGVAAADVDALDAAGWKAANVATQPNATDLAALDAVWAERRLELPEIRRIGLSDALDAVDELERGAVRGKLVVEIDPPA